MTELKKPILSVELATHLGLKHQGSAESITKVSAISDQSSGALVFATKIVSAPKQHISYITSSSLIPTEANMTVMLSNNPRLDFIRAVDYLIDRKHLSVKSYEKGIDRSVRIHPTAVVEPGCMILENSVISAGAVVKQGSRIGKNCIIGENAIIGADGFGFERDKNGNPIHFTHLCGVWIGDCVYVGASSIISRGALWDTKIADHTKINAQVLVGHNVKIGRASYLHAGVVASGGCIIGEQCWIGTNSTVLEKIVIGDNTTIGSGAVVNKDCKAQSVFVGNPIRFLRNAK